MMKLRIIPVISLLLSAASLAGCGSKEDEKQVQPAPVNVSTQHVQKINAFQELAYSATIEPDNTARIGFAVSGIVEQVAVKEGQSVKQGQFLASIDATEYSNALTIANASLEQAEDSYKRLNELYQKGSLPARDYIDIKTKLEQARANKNINQKHIADSRLYASLSGIITERQIEPGSMAGPGMPAFSIIKTDKVYARATVPESEIGNIRPNMPAVVFIPTLNDSIRGTISIINPQADAVSKTYTVKIQLNNASQKLLPGMLANIRLHPKSTQEMIVIPAVAVVRDADDLTYAYVVNAQKKAIRKRITVGELTGNQQVVIKQGLQEGDKVVVEGQTNLKDGAAVNL